MFNTATFCKCRDYESVKLFFSKDTPVGLPSNVAKLGAYSGSNPSRDFRRVFKPPVDRDSKLFVGMARFKCTC